MNVPKDNPAGRLYHILKAAKGQDGKKATIDVYLEVLEAKSSSTEDAIHIIGELLELYNETLESMSYIEGLDLREFKRHLASIPKVLNPRRLNHEWQGVRKDLGPEALLALALCAEKLSSQDFEEQLNLEELAALLQEVEAMIQLVLDSPLDQVIKAFLVRNLQVVRQAIEEYKLYGPLSLRQALEKTTGAILLRAGEIQEKGSPTEVSAFRGILQKLYMLVSFAEKAKSLVEPIIRSLPQ